MSTTCVKRQLVDRRLDLGLSILAAATQMGVEYKTLQRAENGLRIWVSSAKKIADFYGLRVTEIWTPKELAG